MNLINEVAEIVAEEHTLQGLFQTWFYTCPQDCTPEKGDWDYLIERLGRDISVQEERKFVSAYRKHLEKLQNL